MQPDILLEHATHGTIVLDAKWKRPHGRPAEADLRQLFAYAQHFGATRARLLYPQSGVDESVEGAFGPKLFRAETGVAAEIQGGVSYLRVADAGHEGSYLECSIEQKINDWLPA